MNKKNKGSDWQQTIRKPPRVKEQLENVPLGKPDDYAAGGSGEGRVERQKIKLVKKTIGWRKRRRRRWSSSALRFEGWWKRKTTEPALTGAPAATICNSFPDYSLRLDRSSILLSLVSVIRSVRFRRTQKLTYITKHFNWPSSLPWTGGINKRTGAAQALPTGW